MKIMLEKKSLDGFTNMDKQIRDQQLSQIQTSKQLQAYTEKTNKEVNDKLHDLIQSQSLDLTSKIDGNRHSILDIKLIADQAMFKVKRRQSHNHFRILNESPNQVQRNQQATP